MRISADGIQAAADREAYYAHVFGLDQPTEPTHVNYRHDDGTGAHAFMCTDLMKPRSYHLDPNGLPRCRITINPDDALN